MAVCGARRGAMRARAERLIEAVLRNGRFLCAPEDAAPARVVALGAHSHRCQERPQVRQ
jgi:hypothetical protein